MSYDLINTTANGEVFNLSKYPTPEMRYQHKFKQHTYGDMHGNFLKMLNLLLLNNVIQISKNEYKELKDIYLKITRLLEEYESSRNQNTKLKIDNMLQRFRDILNAAEYNFANFNLECFIGDETGDRGENDYFSLYLIKKLVENKVKSTILFSNHGVEFVHSSEFKFAIRANVIHDCQVRSLLNLQRLIKNGFVSQEEVTQLTNEGYKSILQVLTYSIDEKHNRIHFYSHAGIDHEVIEGLAAKLNITYADDSITSIAKTIDLINEKFKSYVQSDRVHLLYDLEVMQKAALDPKYIIDKKANPFEFIMLNRNYSILNRPDEYKGYLCSWTHGHDSQEKTQKNIFVIDEDFGYTDSMPMVETGVDAGDFRIIYKSKMGTDHFLLSSDVPAYMRDTINHMTEDKKLITTRIEKLILEQAEGFEDGEYILESIPEPLVYIERQIEDGKFDVKTIVEDYKSELRELITNKIKKENVNYMQLVNQILGISVVLGAGLGLLYANKNALFSSAASKKTKLLEQPKQIRSSL